jgi:hypothetical protein
VSVLPKEKADPLSSHRYRQTLPLGRTPPLLGLLQSGFALPSSPKQRRILILIVA